MRSERNIRNVVPFFTGHFDQHRGVADVGIGDPDAQFDVAAAAPSPRTDENELLPRHKFIELAYGLPDGQEIVEGPDLAVLSRVDIDNMRDVGHDAVGNELVGRKKGGFIGNMGRNFHGRVIRGEALRPALENMEVVSVGGELDVHGNSKGRFQGFENGLDL